jgi:hypothetical protein
MAFKQTINDENNADTLIKIYIYICIGRWYYVNKRYEWPESSQLVTFMQDCGNEF